LESASFVRPDKHIDLIDYEEPMEELRNPRGNNVLTLAGDQY
jgi:hypothetical protein